MTKPGRVPDILLYLLERGETYQLRILKDLRMGPNTLLSAVESLVKLGFLYQRKETGWPTKRYYALTYKGEEIARNLIPIEAMLKDTLEGFKRNLSKLLRRKKTKKNMEKVLELSLILQELTRETAEWKDSMQHSKRVLELSDKLKSERSKAEAYRNIGFINQKREGYEQAARYFEKSLEIALELEDFQGICNDEYALGVTFEKLGEYDNAIDHYKTSIKLSRKTKDESREARARLGIGRIHFKRGRLSKSMDEMKKAVRELEKLGEFEELPRAYANLGSSSLSLGERETLRWHEKCIEASRKTGNIRMLGYGYSNAAACYMNEHKWKRSREYLERAMEIFQKLDDERMISSIHLHYANMYNLRKEWRLSEESFHKGLRIAEKLSVPSQVADILFHFALMFKNKGDNKKANHYFEKASRMFEDVQNKEKMREIEGEMEGINR